MIKWITTMLHGRREKHRLRGKAWAEEMIRDRGLSGLISEFDANRAMGAVDSAFDEGVLDVIERAHTPVFKDLPVRP
jgi:hypothetical protein